MLSLMLHATNLLVRLLPSTRFFGVKRLLWRCCGVAVGNGVAVNLGAFILGQGRVRIGADTWVGLRCGFIVPQGASVEIGANCDLAPDVMFECGSHEIGGAERRAGRGTATSIRIGDGCWIGVRVTLLGGATLGEGCVAAAGAVVLPGEYPANSLLAGIPARVVRSLPMGVNP